MSKRPQPPKQNISVGAPGTFVHIAGQVLHPSLYEIDPSKIQQFTGTLTIKDLPGLPVRVRELLDRWVAAPDAPADELLFEVWVVQPLQVRAMGGGIQVVPAFLYMQITDLIWRKTVPASVEEASATSSEASAATGA